MANAPTVEERLAALASINATNVGEQKISALYKGPSGTGKTYNALSYPDPVRGIYADPNLKTLADQIKAGKDIDLVVPSTWAEYEDIFCPAVDNRLVEAETIVVDTIDFLSQMMWTEIQGVKPRLTIPDFGLGLNKLVKTTRQLTRATRSIEGKRNYNVIFCVHTRDVTDDSGGLEKIAPAIMGQFKDAIEGFFDYVFLCEATIVSEIKSVNGRKVSVPSARFQVRTVPPSPKHTCKGPGLPSVLGGTYQEIVKALG